jgi:hypothetical protein
MTLVTFTLLPFAARCREERVLALGAEGASEPKAKRGEDVTGEPCPAGPKMQRGGRGHSPRPA